MQQPSIRMIILLLGVIIFLGIFNSLIKKRANESVGILWIVLGIVSIICGIFPKIFDTVAYSLNIDYPPVLVLILFICLLLYLAHIHAFKLSAQEAKIKELAIQISLLEGKQGELEKPVPQTTCKGDSEAEVDL